MNSRQYSQAFKEDVVRKMLMRGNRTIADMADELNVPYHSARNWLRDPRMTHFRRSLPSEKHPCEWSAEQQLRALLETHNLSRRE